MPRLRACIIRPLSASPRIACLTALLLGASLAIRAQMPLATPAQQPGQPYTLHVYKRVVQIPTLVLTADRRPFDKPIDRTRFNVSLDNGPHFHPTRSRLEGDDPISLAILLDVGGSQPDLLPALQRDLSAWIATSFQPQDRISIYAVDCSLARTALHSPPDPQFLTHQLQAALSSTIPHRGRLHPSCGNSIPLWNALIAIMKNQIDQPGRRVILAFTLGYNGAGPLNWDDVRAVAARTGNTIFGYAQRGYIDISATDARDRATFSELCQTSGGLTDFIDTRDLPATLTSFSAMLRNRYILEFPIPFNPTSGTHNIRVDIAHLDAFIQPAGVDFDIPDPSLAKDPSTVPSNEADAPQMGKHRTPRQP